MKTWKRNCTDNAVTASDRRGKFLRCKTRLVGLIGHIRVITGILVIRASSIREARAMERRSNHRRIKTVGTRLLSYLWCGYPRVVV